MNEEVVQQPNSLAEYVEGKIKKKGNQEEKMAQAIYFLQERLQGNSLHDILNMYITQFNVMLEMAVNKAKEEEKQNKKGRKK